MDIRFNGELFSPKSSDYDELAESVIEKDFSAICHGSKTAYCDGKNSNQSIDVLSYKSILGINLQTGRIRCQAGATVSEVIKFVSAYNLFLPVCPGARTSTIGGMVACDVFSKNHHTSGRFSEHIYEIKLLIGTGEIINCSRTEHSALFYATCGGLGLTGIILEVEFNLSPIKSQYYNRLTTMTYSLQETAKVLLKKKSPYKFGWVDLLDKKKQRGIVFEFEEVNSEDVEFTPMQQNRYSLYGKRFPIPIVSHKTLSIINNIYLQMQRLSASQKQIGYQEVFFKLEQIEEWQFLNGPTGQVYYQFVLPKKNIEQGLEEILSILNDKDIKPYLIIMYHTQKLKKKVFSFATDGVSFNMYFHRSKNLFQTLNQIDQTILKYDGTVILQSDSRLSIDRFRDFYTCWPNFEYIRKSTNAINKFQSSQSIRLQI